MAKTNDSGKWTWAFVLTFLGSLVFLYVAYNVLTAPAAWWTSLPLFGGAGAVFLPIFAGVSIISAIVLFFSSFGLMQGGKGATEMVTKSSMITGITLLALTLGSVWSWYSLLGFVLASIGITIAWMAMM